MENNNWLDEHIFTAICYLYRDKALGDPSCVSKDKKNKYLFADKTRDGREVLRYEKNNKSFAIYIDDYTYLTEQEIKEQF